MKIFHCVMMILRYVMKVPYYAMMTLCIYTIIFYYYGAGAYPGFSSRRVKGYVGHGAKVQESAKVTLHLFSKRKFLAVFLYEER